MSTTLHTNAPILSLNKDNHTFTLDSFRIRSTSLNGEWYFCLADVCASLGLTDPSNTTRQIRQEFSLDSLPEVQFESGKGLRSYTVVSESHLYYVMMRGRTELACKFRNWICTEVLPALHKHGSYTMPSHKLDAKSVKERFAEIIAEIPAGVQINPESKVPERLTYPTVQNKVTEVLSGIVGPDIAVSINETYSFINTMRLRQFRAICYTIAKKNPEKELNEIFSTAALCVDRDGIDDKIRNLVQSFLPANTVTHILQAEESPVPVSMPSYEPNKPLYSPVNPVRYEPILVPEKLTDTKMSKALKEAIDEYYNPAPIDVTPEEMFKNMSTDELMQCQVLLNAMVYERINCLNEELSHTHDYLKGVEKELAETKQELKKEKTSVKQIEPILLSFNKDENPADKWSWAKSVLNSLRAL